MLLPGAVHRVVCSSLELRQALLLNGMPSHMTALALGNGRMFKRKKGSFCGLDLLKRPLWSVLLEAMCGLCYSQRPCGCQGSMLPLEESTAYAAAGCYGHGSFFAVMSMTGDSQLRMRDPEGFCDTLLPSPSETVWAGSH